jgi:hypothetical protein
LIAGNDERQSDVGVSQGGIKHAAMQSHF